MKKILVLFVILVLVFGGAFVAYYYTTQQSSNKSNLSDNQTNSIDEANHQIYAHSDYKAINPKDLYDLADLVIVGKYSKANKSYVKDAASIVTESTFEVSKVIKGDYSSKNININYYGGKVTLGEYVKTQTKEQLQKKGLSNLSTEQLSRETVELVIENSSVQVSNNEEYIIFLSYDKEDDYYFVLCDGYGMRKLSGNQEIYNLDTKTFDTKITELK